MDSPAAAIAVVAVAIAPAVAKVLAHVILRIAVVVPAKAVIVLVAAAEVATAMVAAVGAETVAVVATLVLKDSRAAARSNRIHSQLFQRRPVSGRLFCASPPDRDTKMHTT